METFRNLLRRAAAFAERVAHRCRLIWKPVSRRLWLLWACRISVISAAAGLLLFWQATQAQNLFADISWNASIGSSILFWTWVFFSLFFLWAFPVHYAARRALEEDDWLIAKRLREELELEQRSEICNRLRQPLARWIKWTPRVLGCLPFVAFAVGITREYLTLPAAGAIPEVGETNVQLAILLVLDLLAFLAFVWFIRKRQDIVKIGAPVDSRTNRRILSPRRENFLHGLAIFFLIVTALLSLFAYFAPVMFSNIFPRAALVPFIIGSPVLIWGWLARKSDRFGVPFVAIVVIIFAVVTASNVHFNDIRTLKADAKSETDQRQIDLDEALTRWAKANDCASDHPKTCPTALIIAADGGASRASFMTATAIGALLDEMKRQGVDLETGAPARRIFALSGVSGGAIGVAVIKAALADAATDDNRTPCQRAPREWFKAPEFWREDKAPSTWRDCLQALVSGDYLSAVFPGLAYRDNFPLPFLIKEDRAVLLEQAFERHYNFVTCNGTQSCSRAPVVFETAENCTDQDADRGLCRRFGYIKRTNEAGARAKSWIPLLALNATSVQSGRRIIVSDLVSTSSRDQKTRQSLYPEAYDLFEAMSSPCGAPDKDACPAVVGNFGEDVPATRDAPDLRLSTAALTSARFPIISPAGAFGMKGNVQRGDQLVDGGFFENSGLSTARDIANGLQIRGISVAVLTIANEPEAIADAVVPRRAAKTPLIGTSEVAAPVLGFVARLFGLASAPITSLYNTREGHGVESRNEALLTVDPQSKDPTASPAQNKFFKIGVFAKTKEVNDANETSCAPFTGKIIGMSEVSMSWWLSGAVQADLDAQMCDPRNRNTIYQLVELLTAPATSTSQ